MQYQTLIWMLLVIERLHMDIDQVYENLVTMITNTGAKYIPRSVFKPFIKPYRDKDLSLLHYIDKDKRAQWINENKLRGEHIIIYSGP